MNLRVRLCLLAMGTGLVLGLLGDGLLRAVPWGINACLWLLAVAAAIVVVRAKSATRGEPGVLLAVAAVFALMFLFRSAGPLLFLDFTAALFALTLAAWSLRGHTLRTAFTFDYIRAATVVGANLAGGLPRLAFVDTAWRRVPKPNVPLKFLQPVAIGLLLALPMLLIFTGLFAAADPVFEKVLDDFFSSFTNFDPARVAGHILLTGFLTWTTAGLLQVTLFKRRSLVSIPFDVFRVGAVEVGIALSLINLLFFAFVAVQIRYFFGGDDLVAVTPGLSYADYARRGFFELVFATALVTPMLLVFHCLLRQGNRPAHATFRALAAILIALVFVVIVSALFRMQLYVDAYGLTRDRLFATAFMAWLFLGLVWLGATVLRGQPRRFASGAVAAGFAVLLLLNLLNPDAFIARHNLERAATGGRSLDTDYMAQLSADAVPTLVAALPSLSPETRKDVTYGLTVPQWDGSTIGRYDGPSPYALPQDWRAWNFSRMRAQWAISTLEPASTNP